MIDSILCRLKQLDQYQDFRIYNFLINAKNDLPEVMQRVSNVVER